MKLGFFVNDIKKEVVGYTTIRMAMEAHNRGHNIWMINAGDFSYDTDENIHAWARIPAKKRYNSQEKFLSDLQIQEGKEKITVDELDILMLRNDPASEPDSRAWAKEVGINFGRLALRHGVIVLSDPEGLAKAINKMYFQLFPAEVRPRTIITRDSGQIIDFIRDQNTDIILKPLQGSGGRSVFLVRQNDLSNIHQMIDSVKRDGYVIAQEYLPAAEEGDIRLFLMNGAPLCYKGKYAAFRRVPSAHDIRSNISAGGKSQKAKITEKHLNIAEIVRPKLVQDGMFLVGLDIVGDKLMEINVFSPGGITSAQHFEKVKFTEAIIDSLEHKVKQMRYYDRHFDNVEMASL